MENQVQQLQNKLSQTHAKAFDTITQLSGEKDALKAEIAQYQQLLNAISTAAGLTGLQNADNVVEAVQKLAKFKNDTVADKVPDQKLPNVAEKK